MGLSSLNAALAGLRVSQQQISVISNNVANVSTEGYTRKILPQSAQSIAGVTSGVISEVVMRNVDLNLERDLWTQISSVGSLEVRESYLSRIEEFHGAPDDELSVSAEISRLKDSFSILSDTPEDTFLLASTVTQAQTTSNKINDLADLILTARNDAQSDLQATIERVNQLLEQIADLNNNVQDNLNIGRSTAITEDLRDGAIKELSNLIELSFFTRGDGVMVVQTNNGVELANTQAKRLEFDPTPLSASTYYPDADIGIYVVDQQFSGDAATEPSALNITEIEPGGRIGGLLELRDTDFPKQMAELDELAHKLALRFEAQGLQLYTDASGSIPADTPPDLTADPIIPVEYIGFAQSIQVNEDILEDSSLLRTGTYGATDIQSGSNEVIQRILNYTFGDVEYQEAYNSDTTTQVDLLNTGGDDLQTWLGLVSSNTINGSRDLSSFVDPDGVGALTPIDNLTSSTNGILAATSDTFRISFEDSRLGLGPESIDISLASAALQAGATAGDQIVAEINAQIGTLTAGLTAGLNPVASVGTNGEIVISSSGNFTIDATTAPANPMGSAGLSLLGLGEGTYTTTDPYFDVQVGNDDATRIYIEPGDTGSDLITKLQAVRNLAVDQTNFALDGLLRIRPGDDDTFTAQNFGGALKITGGPFETSTASYGSPPATTGTRTAVDDSVNIASALFGSYSVNSGVVSDSSPVTSSSYESFTDSTLTTTQAFRTDNLGPSADISIDLSGSSTLIDFAQKMVNSQTQEIIQIENALADDISLRDILQTQLNNESGVNLDEELSNLIVQQTAYSASARVITAVDELFQELLNAI